MADKTDTGSQEQVKTLDERINETLSTADDKGMIDFGENVDPVFKKLVLTEKKARQHQAKAIKTIQENAKLKAKSEVLESTISSSAQLSAEQVEELEELKLTNPDEWFNKKVQYEAEAKQQLTGKLQEQIDEASTKAINELTLSERKDVMARFSASTGINLTDDVMQNDIPPRLQAKINDMPFEDYLKEVATYLNKGKVVKQVDDELGQTNLGKLAGSGQTKQSKSNSYAIL